MPRLKRFALGLGIALLAILPWVAVVWFAWANTTFGSPGDWRTDWSSLRFTLLATLAGAALVLAVCLAEKSLRPYVRGWRLIPTSWVVALGGMFWVSLSTFGYF